MGHRGHHHSSQALNGEGHAAADGAVRPESTGQATAQTSQPSSWPANLRGGRQRRELPRAEQQGVQIVVDGSNIAWLECTSDGKPKVSNILKVRDELVAKGFEPVILCDAALYHQVDDAKLLNQLIDQQVIAQAPAQTDADYFVLETADRLGAQVVSDDQYKPYLAQYSWIAARRVPVMIIEGMVEFYEEKLEEPGQASETPNQPTAATE